MPNHVFISYVREDYADIERIANHLQENGIRIWLDRNDIPPGARWKRVIRRAISDGGFFLACFSPSYSGRSLTYMNEELTLAIDMLRKMPPDRCWFVPVLLAECEIPDLDITASETLRDLQQIRLYQDWESGIRKIISVINSEDPPLEPAKVPVPSDLMEPMVVLFLAATPIGTEPIQLDQELREIQGAIMGSQSRNHFEMISRMAIRPRDLSESILSARPQIIHFSGHGSVQRGLVVENDQGRATFIGWETLGNAIGVLADRVECVVLNVNSPPDVANFIPKKVPYIISTGPETSDDAAIAFSAGFYQALGNGRTIEESFQVGCTQIALEGFSEEATPVLQCNRSKAKRRTPASTGRPASPSAR
ncbi:MAG TPA: TIR domain-containing protein [Pyrinomonadaceae bacterium]|nr:TIR domain-containing protein [Pyrinomonadaceae bacterium]